VSYVIQIAASAIFAIAFFPVSACGQEKPQLSAEQIAFFESRIRPLLLEHCAPCHGASKQESGLRVDSRQALLQGGLRGPAVDTAQPSRSLLLLAVRKQSEELAMPPDRTLDQAAINDLERWILQGAYWPEYAAAETSMAKSLAEHWSFQPVKAPAVPQLETCWARNPIDLFIYEKLAAAGLQPSVEADRRVLIRRLYFGLLGLPPPPEEVEAFLTDKRPDAYERLVDRLLASPHYGERWGRYWLDVARYADTKGYVFFEEERFPWSYTYRDYVISAWNEDLPYDQFVRDQIAADLIANSTISDNNKALAALGFLTVGGRFMNNVHDIIDDRIDVVMRGVLGITFTCARCHDHKYDPFTQEEYYSVYGIFASCYEPTVPPVLFIPDNHVDYSEYNKELQDRERKFTEFVVKHHQELVESSRRRIADYLMAAYRERFHPPTDNFMLITDKGDLNPAMVLRWHAYLHDTRRLHARVWEPWRVLAHIEDAHFSEQAPVLLQQVLSEPKLINPLVYARLKCIQQPFTMQDIATAYEEVLHAVEAKWQKEIQEAAAAGRRAPDALADPDEEELRQVLYGDDSPTELPISFDWGFLSLFPDRATQEEFKKHLKELEQWLMRADAPPRAMVLWDRPKPILPRVFLRGNPNRPGRPVSRKLPRLLDSPDYAIREGSGRRELAEALTSVRNPLTARVIVNRLWMHHFGRGLVNTPGDFGLRGELPSHPELLDWLAWQLMHPPEGESLPANEATLRWSLKRIQRLIVCSATYRQSSKSHPQGMAIDPENRLLWRAPLRRLDWEAQRDALLAVADGWEPRIGGPSVDIWTDRWVPRRTLYGFLNRLNVPPLAATFDFPSPNATASQRPSTTTSLQALFWLNHPTVADAARRVLERPDIQQAVDTDDRLLRLYLLLFSRPPEDADRLAAYDYLGAQPEDATWHRFVHALLMTNEFVILP